MMMDPAGCTPPTGIEANEQTNAYSTARESTLPEAEKRLGETAPDKPTETRWEDYRESMP